ncbi:hypothetical protein [Ktedonobacter racemifer]|nr:hypothetical protein [Ktedonobacter racemifer]
MSKFTFVAALKYLLERVPLEVDLNTSLSRWRWWATGCVGCIGILKDWLVDAVAATLIQNGTSLTEAVLTATIPHPARRLSLEMEARAGEHSIARHDSESAKQFQALVKKPTKRVKEEAKQATGNGPGVPHADQVDQMKESSAATVLPMPQVTPKPTKPRVGQRAPERDPVGITPSPAQKSVGCFFTEVIPVTRAQAEEEGVSRFECPICLATRTLTFAEGSMRFPWHPKRTTVTPNHGLRWVKREIWQLSEK